MNDTAQHARGCTLRALAGDQHIEIAADTVVGRDAACDVVLQQGQTSRKHARLSPRPEGVWIEDLQSTNGTFINDQRLAGGAMAQHGDVVRFDTVAFELVIEGAEAVDTGATVLRAPPKPAPAAPSPGAPKPVPKEQVVAAKSNTTPPPSWALDGMQNVDGTQLFSGTMMKHMGAGEPADNNAAAPVTIPTLIGVNEKAQGLRFQLVASGTVNQWEIGRAEQCDIRIDDPSISKNHAQIINEGNRWKLIDLMSANGTYVNGTKGLTSYLKSGDNVRFGQVECRFLLAENGADTAPRSAATPAQGAAQKGSRLKLAVLSFVVTAIIVAAVVWWLGHR